MSRIERGEISPSIDTLRRMLGAMGEEIELTARPLRDNRSDEELRADYELLTPAERIAQTAALSRTLTGIAAGRRS